MKKRGKDFEKLKSIIETLAKGLNLEIKYKDHKLSGNWGGWRECHIAPDWLLIYKIDKQTLELARTGSHADLFG